MKKQQPLEDASRGGRHGVLGEAWPVITLVITALGDAEASVSGTYFVLRNLWGQLETSNC